MRRGYGESDSIAISQAGTAGPPRPHELERGLTRSGEGPGFYGMVGQSQSFREVCATVVKAARADCTVLIEGESGTGKELVAHAIHRASPRAAQPFIPVDCGAINANLIESELFGHMKGAFTGAHEATRGLLRAAGGGTAFLDEVAEIPLLCQAKLLRSLQEMEVIPVGGTRPEKLEARIVAATNKDLEELVGRAEFRNDLYYRLHVVVIDLPALRERREDIPLLARYFLAVFNDRGSMKKGFAKGVIEALCAYDWPGNIRELQNGIERAYALSRSDIIGPDDLMLKRPVSNKTTVIMGMPLRTLGEMEREAIHNALLSTKGIKSVAARALGIGVTTLYRKLKQYGGEWAPKPAFPAPEPA